MIVFQPRSLYCGNDACGPKAIQKNDPRSVRIGIAFHIRDFDMYATSLINGAETVPHFGKGNLNAPKKLFEGLNGHRLDVFFNLGAATCAGSAFIEEGEVDTAQYTEHGHVDALAANFLGELLHLGGIEDVI